MSATLTALVDPRILDQGAAPVYVAHDVKGRWRVGARGFVDLAPAAFRQLPLSEVRAIDDSIDEVLDLAAGTHAFRPEPRASWRRGPMPRGPVYLLSYELRPSPATGELDGIGGAFVNCWVKRPSLDGAVQAAAEHLTDSGWVILSEETTRPVTAEEVPEQSARYFRQAEVDGEVFVIHSFPPEEPDA